MAPPCFRCVAKYGGFLMNTKLAKAAADPRQAAERLEVDGDVDGSELDAIADVVMGPLSLINQADMALREAESRHVARVMQ